MLPKIRPVIEVIGESLVLTASHDVREQVWKILSLTSDDYLIEKRGGTPTQISVEAYPGRPRSAAFTILATATFLAEIDNLETIWKTTCEQLSSEIGQRYYLADVVLERVYVDYLVNRYIQATATRKLKAKFENKFSGLGYNESVLIDWLDEVIECYRRYTDKHNGRSSDLEAKNLETFNAALKAAKRINLNIKTLKAGVLNSIKEFEESFDTESPQGLVNFAFIVEDIQTASKAAKVENETFPHEDNTYQALLREIRLSTPPAPAPIVVKK